MADLEEGKSPPVEEGESPLKEEVKDQPKPDSAASKGSKKSKKSKKNVDEATLEEAESPGQETKKKTKA